MKIKDFLEKLLGHMGIDQAQISVKERAIKSLCKSRFLKKVRDCSWLSRRCFSRLQRIAQLLYRDDWAKKVIVNVNDYKQRRESPVARYGHADCPTRSAGRERVCFCIFTSQRTSSCSPQTISGSSEFAELESLSVGEGSARRLHIRLKQGTPAEEVNK